MRLSRLFMSLVWLFQLALAASIATLSVDRIIAQYYGLAPATPVLAMLAGFWGMGSSIIGIISPYPSLDIIPIVVVLGANALSFAFYFLMAVAYSIGLRTAACHARFTRGAFVDMSHNPLLNLGALHDEGTTAYGHMQLRNPARVLRLTCEKAVTLQSILIAAFLCTAMTVLVTWRIRRRKVAGPLARIASVLRQNGASTSPHMVMEAVRAERGLVEEELLSDNENG